MAFDYVKPEQTIMTPDGMVRRVMRATVVDIDVASVQIGFVSNGAGVIERQISANASVHITAPGKPLVLMGPIAVRGYAAIAVIKGLPGGVAIMIALRGANTICGFALPEHHRNPSKWSFV